MKNRWLVWGLIALNIFAISFFIIRFTNSTYPLVGNDYRLFGPRLLDSLLHYKINGFSIEWYTPSFGGGLPAYPNPLQMQFSFQQLFTFFVEPYTAILIACVVYIAIGFLAAYFLLRDVLEQADLSAILGANFFVACGFVIERMIVGHADKITFPLIAVPIYALLNRKLPAWLNGVLIGLTGAILLHSGGVYIGVMCLFTALVCLPLMYLLKPGLFSPWKHFIPVSVWAGVLTLLLCGSKLYAVATFMQNFPRTIEDHYFVSLASSITGAALQLIGVMPTLPFLKVIGKSALVLTVRLTQLTGSPYGFWELDSSISPALILLLIYGLWTIIRRKVRLEKGRLLQKIIAGILLGAAVVLVFQFAEARGFLFEHLHGLAVFKSLRTNTRFISAFVLPLTMLGGAAFDHWLVGKQPWKAVTGFALLDMLALVSLLSYYLLPLKVQYRSFDVQPLLLTYAGIEAGETYPVWRIIPEMNDYEVFMAGATNVGHHYDPLLSEHSFLPRVHEGKIEVAENGFYNMTDPTGYVFPAENGSDLFSLIPVSETAELHDFLNRRQPDWKLPLTQIILDWLSGLTFLSILLAIPAFLARGPLARWQFLRFKPFSWLKRS